MRTLMGTVLPEQLAGLCRILTAVLVYIGLVGCPLESASHLLYRAPKITRVVRAVLLPPHCYGVVRSVASIDCFFRG